MGRRQAHEAGDGEATAFAARRNESIGLFRQDAGLLRLATGIDLDEQRGRAGISIATSRPRGLRLVRLTFAPSTSINWRAIARPSSAVGIDWFKESIFPSTNACAEFGENSPSSWIFTMKLSPRLAANAVTAAPSGLRLIA